MFITTAHQRCLTSLTVSGKYVPELLSIICSLQNWGLVCWETTSGVKSRVLCCSSSSALLHAWCAGGKSCQLLDRCLAASAFEQQDITVICTIRFHPWLRENHTSASEPGNTEWNWYTGTCLSEASEGRQWAEVASDWNVVSNQQSYIDQATDQWRDCFNACLKVKSKHFEHLLWRVFP